jgi:hypothetical protein
MVLPDGDVVVKTHGMPSGWPNTIRVNSVINRVVTYVNVIHRHDSVDLDEYDANVLSQFCGDDSRRLLLPGWEDFCDDLYYDKAKHTFPKWVIKREGQVHIKDFEGRNHFIHASPPFVSRVYVKQDGMYWSVPFDLVRLTAKLVHEERGETPEMTEAKALGVEVQMMHLLNWHRRGLLRSDFLDKYRQVFSVHQALCDQLYDAQVTLAFARATSDIELYDWVKGVVFPGVEADFAQYTDGSVFWRNEDRI